MHVSLSTVDTVHTSSYIEHHLVWLSSVVVEVLPEAFCLTLQGHWTGTREPTNLLSYSLYTYTVHLYNENAGKLMKYGISIVEYSRTISEPSPRYLHVHTLYICKHVTIESQTTQRKH